MSPSTVPAVPSPDERPAEPPPQGTPPAVPLPAGGAPADASPADAAEEEDDGLADAVREAIRPAASRSGRTSRSDAARAVADAVISPPPADAAPAPALPPILRRRTRDWIAERLLHDPAARERLDALRGQVPSTGGSSR